MGYNGGFAHPRRAIMVAADHLARSGKSDASIPSALTRGSYLAPKTAPEELKMVFGNSNGGPVRAVQHLVSHVGGTATRLKYFLSAVFLAPCMLC